MSSQDRAGLVTKAQHTAAAMAVVINAILIFFIKILFYGFKFGYSFLQVFGYPCLMYMGNFSLDGRRSCHGAVARFSFFKNDACQRNARKKKVENQVLAPGQFCYYTSTGAGYDTKKFCQHEQGVNGEQKH